MQAAAAYKLDPDSCVKMVTDYCVNTGEQMTRDWLSFWMFLFANYRDMATVLPPSARQCDLSIGQKTDCTARTIPDFDEHVHPYSRQFYGRIIEDPINAQHYAVPPSMGDDSQVADHAAHKLMRMAKRTKPTAADRGFLPSLL